VPKQYKAYLMRFEPKWPTLTKEHIERAMAEADFCWDAPRGFPLGSVQRIGLVSETPTGRSPKFGVKVRIVELRHHGKLAVMEEIGDV